MSNRILTKSKSLERSDTHVDTLEEVLARPGTREALKVIHGWRDQDGVFGPPRSISPTDSIKAATTNRT